ncbi:MAG: hypothetical protein DRN33_05850 [Thermoplasmata archaeon]|nr:MAG: hypothetical protein DRN33_05850 [Thermoplasmata archaeon]
MEIEGFEGLTIKGYTIIERAHNDKSGSVQWLGECIVCGTEKFIRSVSLRCSDDKSYTVKPCRVCRNNGRDTKISNSIHFVRYHQMKQRCYNPKSPSYKWYGGKGITVCDEWLASTEAFILWCDKNYIDGCTLDRRDGSKGYNPDNCRFATNSEQARNKGMRSNNTSGYVGAIFDKSCNRWMARITVNREEIHLGMFTTAKDAGHAYDEFITINGLDHTRNKDLIK